MTLVVHAAATWALVGLIWVVQLVIYPLYASVPEHGFRAFHAAYTARIGAVVGTLMAIEALSGVLLFTHTTLARPALWIGTALLVLLWLLTGLAFVPLHARLAAGFDPAAHRRLVALNWLRTAAWTARGALVATWLL